MIGKTKERLEKLEQEIADLKVRCSTCPAEARRLRHDINMVFSRVSRDFKVHSEKIDPEKEP